MTKQEIYYEIVHHIQGIYDVISENLSFAYQPNDLTQVQYCHGTIVVVKQNGQAFKYQIKYYHQPDVIKKFSIRCIGEVVTHGYIPSEDEM